MLELLGQKDESIQLMEARYASLEADAAGLKEQLASLEAELRARETHIRDLETASIPDCALWAHLGTALRPGMRGSLGGLRASAGEGGDAGACRAGIPRPGERDGGSAGQGG